jgi:hypothetical protein
VRSGRSVRYDTVYARGNYGGDCCFDVCISITKYVTSLFEQALHLNKAKSVPPHAMKALGGRGGIAPTHSRPRH